MRETPALHFNLEWPEPGQALLGPEVWLGGWVVGKTGFTLTDVRARTHRGVHLGLLGLPRPDLAAHFGFAGPVLPAGFVIGLALADATTSLVIEAMDTRGNWHVLTALDLVVSPTGQAHPRREGSVIVAAGGSQTIRLPHAPFHGHLDEPAAKPAVRQGQARVFGWLLHERERIARVFATTDGVAYAALACNLTDDALATRLPQLPSARHARIDGLVTVPPTASSPACLRVFAELADGTVHLCFAHRLELPVESATRTEVTDPAPPPVASPQPSPVAPMLPSGRPRRALLAVRRLRADEAAGRALDVVRHMARSPRWRARLLATEDGPLRAAFEEAGCAVQLVDTLAYFTAPSPAAKLAALDELERGIWLGHLDAVAVFDPDCDWLLELAGRHGVPGLRDPVADLAWYPRDLTLAPDPAAPMLALVRGDPGDGAWDLLAAARELALTGLLQPGTDRIQVGGLQPTPLDPRFRASLELNPSTLTISPCAADRASALICPAFAAHPHRTVLAAIAAGIPAVSTPSGPLGRVFGPNEVHFVPAGNPLALAHAIADLVQNPAAAQRRAKAARRLAAAHFAPEAALEQWLARLGSAPGP